LGTIRTGDYTEDLSENPTAALDDTKCDWFDFLHQLMAFA
jgi:hypothetical protein